MSSSALIMIGIVSIPFLFLGLIFLTHSPSNKLRCNNKNECIYNSCGSYYKDGKELVAMVCYFCGDRKDVSPEEAIILENIAFSGRHRRFGVSLGGRDE